MNFGSILLAELVLNKLATPTWTTGDLRAVLLQFLSSGQADVKISDAYGCNREEYIRWVCQNGFKNGDTVLLFAVANVFGANVKLDLSNDISLYIRPMIKQKGAPILCLSWLPGQFSPCLFN
jgi:hypothetical protein